MTTATISANSGATYSGSDDCQIKESTPTYAYGGGGYPTMEVSAYGVADWCNALIAFPALAGISGPVTVTSATLRIYQNADDAGVNTHTLSAFRALRPWTESAATWNAYDGTNNWGTAGAKASTDRSTTTSATASSPAGTVGYIDFTGAQLAADVQAFINGTLSNYGWVLARTDGANDSTWRQFATSLGTDGQRPILSITYGPAAPSITSQPTQQSPAVGGTATYSLTATSANGAITYQWYRAPATSLLSNTPGAWSAISGATSNSYTTGALSSSDDGAWFYCVATDSVGSVSSLAARLFLDGASATGAGARGATGLNGWVYKRRGRGQSYDMLLDDTPSQDSAAVAAWTDWFGLDVATSAVAASIGTWSQVGVSGAANQFASASIGAVGWSGVTASAWQFSGSGVALCAWSGVAATASQFAGSVVGALAWTGLSGSSPGQIQVGIGSVSWSGVAGGTPAFTSASVAVCAWSGIGAASPSSASAGIGAYSWTGVPAGVAQVVSATVGATSWSGIAAIGYEATSAGIGDFGWGGVQAALAGRLIAGIGSITWSGVDCDPAQLLSLNTAGFEWSGVDAVASQLIGAPPAGIAWSGVDAAAFGFIGIGAATFSWLGVDFSASQLASAMPGAFSWSGVRASSGQDAKQGGAWIAPEISTTYVAQDLLAVPVRASAWVAPFEVRTWIAP